MRITLLATFVACIQLFGSCNSQQQVIDCDHVTLLITNDLNVDLQSLEIGPRRITNLDKGSTSAAICLNEVTGHLPDHMHLPFRAVIAGDTAISSSYFEDCFTGFITDDIGEYHIVLSDVMEYDCIMAPCPRVISFYIQ